MPSPSLRARWGLMTRLKIIRIIGYTPMCLHTLQPPIQTQKFVVGEKQQLFSVSGSLTPLLEDEAW
jgi:hypothetical protein